MRRDFGGRIMASIDGMESCIETSAEARSDRLSFGLERKTLGRRWWRKYACGKVCGVERIKALVSSSKRHEVWKGEG